MIAVLFGVEVKIPNGYREDRNGFFINGHGIEYAPIQYGMDEDKTICLETVYATHTRTIELERV